MPWFWMPLNLKIVEFFSFSKIQTATTNKLELTQEGPENINYTVDCNRRNFQPYKADLNAPREFYYVTIRINRNQDKI